MLLDARWNLFEKGELYFNASAAQTEAGYDMLEAYFASDVPISILFPDPGDVVDPANDMALLPDDGYDLSEMHEYSNVDYTEYRATLGIRYRVHPNVGIFSYVSYYDLSDDDPYIQNATGSLKLIGGGLTWHF